MYTFSGDQKEHPIYIYTHWKAITHDHNQCDDPLPFKIIKLREHLQTLHSLVVGGGGGGGNVLRIGYKEGGKWTAICYKFSTHDWFTRNDGNEQGSI